MRPRVTVLGSIVLALATGAPAVAGEQVTQFLIDFESDPDQTPIGDQYAALGVTFSIDGRPGVLPEIALEGQPTTAFTGNGADTPMASGAGGLTDSSLEGPFVPGMIRMTFDPPVTSVRFFIIDIDSGDSFTATAYDGAREVATLTRSAGQPGTGNANATEFFLAATSIGAVVVGDPAEPAQLGWAIDFLTFTRPCEGTECGPTIELAQESAPGAGDFDDHVLGTLLPYPSTSSAASFYAYNVPEGDSWNGQALTPEAERSHLLLATTTEGLTLVIVHDRAVPNDADGGKAEMRFELLDDADGAAITVRDDPPSVEAGFGYVGEAGDSLFEVGWSWMPCCSDGLALSGLDDGATALVQFTDVDPNPNNPVIAGLDEWVAYSAEGATLPLALEPERRVRLRIVAASVTCPADLDGNGQVDGGDLGILLGAWGACADCPADLDGTGQINGADLGILLGAWGPCP